MPLLKEKEIVKGKEKKSARLKVEVNCSDNNNNNNKMYFIQHL